MSNNMPLQSLWEQFLLKLPPKKQYKISQLVDGLPLSMKKTLVSQLLGRAEDTVLAAGIQIPALRESLVQDQGDAIKWKIFALAKPFVFRQVGSYVHGAEIHLDSLEKVWTYCWSSVFSDEIVKLVEPFVVARTLLSESQESSVIEQALPPIVDQLRQFQDNISDDKALLRQITFGMDMNRFEEDLDCLIQAIGANELFQTFESSVPARIPDLKTRQIQCTIVAMRQFENLSNSRFAFLCAKISARLARPYEILKLITFLTSKGVQISRSPYLACIDHAIGTMDRSFSQFKHNQINGENSGRMAMLIAKFAAYSRELRISVDIEAFPTYEHQVIQLRRDFSLVLERIIGSVMELTRRILRTTAWIKARPHLWGADEIDEKQAFLAVQTLYAVDKFASEFSLAVTLTSAKKDLEQYLEVTLKGLLAEEEKLTTKDLKLYKLLVLRGLTMAAYSFEEEYMAYLKGNFERIFKGLGDQAD